MTIYNKIARKFLKRRSLNYKVAYERLQKTETWRNAKALLIEYFSLANNKYICPVCEAELDPYASTMHHDVYDNRRLFDPKYISFLHHTCHRTYHQQKGALATGTVRHLRVFFGSRGMRIYIPRKTKLYIPYELFVLLIVIIFLLIFTL